MNTAEVVLPVHRGSKRSFHNGIIMRELSHGLLIVPPNTEYHHHHDGKWASHPVSTQLPVPSHTMNTESHQHPTLITFPYHLRPTLICHPIPSMNSFVVAIPSRYRHQRKVSYPIHVMIKAEINSASGRTLRWNAMPRGWHRVKALQKIAVSHCRRLSFPSFFFNFLCVRC